MGMQTYTLTVTDPSGVSCALDDLIETRVSERPRVQMLVEMKDKFDLITSDFTYVRWLGPERDRRKNDNLGQGDC